MTGRGMIILSVFVIATIGFAFTFAFGNPIQSAQALNPQPLPQGIVLHYPPNPILPPDPCISAASCNLPPGIILDYPPQPTLHLPPGIDYISLQTLSKR